MNVITTYNGSFSHSYHYNAIKQHNCLALTQTKLITVDPYLTSLIQSEVLVTPHTFVTLWHGVCSGRVPSPIFPGIPGAGSGHIEATHDEARK